MMVLATQLIASSIVRNLELNGLSAVMMEDPKRLRKCGHFEGKEILPIQEYLTKLRNVLESRTVYLLLRGRMPRIVEKVWSELFGMLRPEQMV